MKVLKWVGIGVGIFIVLLLVVPLLLPSTFHAERSIVINRSPQLAYWLVADLTQWEQWSPWREQEPTAVYTFSKPSFIAGSKMDWNGDTVGVGNLTNVELEEGKRIVSKLVFIEDGEMISTIVWKFEPVAQGTKVTWSMDGDAEYLLGRIFGVFIDGMIGPDFERGLENLKQVAESAPEDILQFRLKKSRDAQIGMPEPTTPGIPEDTYIRSEGKPMDVPVTDKEKELDSMNEAMQRLKDTKIKMK